MLLKSTFLANFDVLMSVAPFKSDFVSKLDKSNSTFIVILLRLYGSETFQY